MQYVKVTIDEAGKAKIEVAGAKGAQCLTITKEIEAALGRVDDRKMTREFREVTNATQDQH